MSQQTSAFQNFCPQTYEEKSRAIYENSRSLIYPKEKELKSTFADKMTKDLDLHVPLNIIHTVSKLKNVRFTNESSMITIDLTNFCLAPKVESAFPGGFFSTDTRIITVGLISKCYDSIEQWKKENLKDGNLAFVHSIRKSPTSIWIKFGVLERVIAMPYIRKKRAKLSLSQGLKLENGLDKIREYVNSRAFARDMTDLYGKSDTVDKKLLKKLSSVGVPFDAERKKIDAEWEKKRAEQIERITKDIPAIDVEPYVKPKPYSISNPHPNLLPEERVIIRGEATDSFVVKTTEKMLTPFSNRDRIAAEIPEQ